MVDRPRRTPPLPLSGFWAILVFLAIAAGLAVLLHGLHAGDRLPILLYLAGILVLALGFPGLCGAADKEYVDLLYYGTAMVIAGLLFFSKEVDRQRLALTEEIATIAGRAAAADADIARFDAAVVAAPSLRPWLDDRIEDAFVVTEQQRQQECACAIAGSLGGTQCGGGLVPPTLPSPRDPSVQRTRQQEAAARCGRYDRMLHDAAPDRDPSKRDLAATLRVAQAIGAGGVLTLGPQSLSFDQVASLLQQLTTGPEAARGALVARRAAIGRDGERAEAAYRAAGSQLKSGLSLAAGEITEFYWPYILIAYLGLKIARVDYGAKLRR